jgi:hypothetical protein
MGTVIRFPDEKRMAWTSATARETPASIVILPVIRIERHADDTSGGASPETGARGGAGRRRRARRS